MKAVLETFKPIKGYEGLYEISDYGCVRSLKYGKVKYMKCKKDKYGYSIICLYKNGKKKSFSVHRLEWEAFNAPIADGYEIDHINTIRDDNRLENLRVVTSKENKRNSITAERMRESNRRKAKDPQWVHNHREGIKRRSKNQEWFNNFREGVRRVCAKPIVQLDAETGEVIRHWECAHDAGRELGVSNSNISACCHGKLKTAGGYRWRYATDDD